jgi:hypothetical protein
MEAYREYMQSEIAKIEKHASWIDEPFIVRAQRYKHFGSLDDDKPYKFTPLPPTPGLFDWLWRLIESVTASREVPESIEHMGFTYKLDKRIPRK